jgi:hypothetical protein
MNTRSIVLLVTLPVLTAHAHAQTHLRTVTGAAGDLYGRAVIRAGDQNNDGFEDLLVGAPGANGSNGAIFCLSGAYLALGSGTIHLWSLGGSGSFGTSLASVGNVVGNSAPDFVVGAPALNSFNGGILVVDGSTRVVAATLTGGNSSFAGTSVVALGDVDGDGRSEIAVGAPGLTATVFVIAGSGLSTNGTLVSKALRTVLGSSGFGSSLAGGFDCDGDGRSEVAAGTPTATPMGAPSEAGMVIVFNASPSAPAFVRSYVGSTAGEHLGSSLDAAHDYDGDGRVDLIVGAPDYPVPSGKPDGRAVVLSAAKLAANVPAEIYVLPGGSTTIGGFTTFGWRFGTAVRATPDLNNDGIGDIVVGMSGYVTGLGGTPRGAARLFSGKTGGLMCHVSGGSQEAIGDCVLGALGDLDGDGFTEWIVAGPYGDNPSTNCGVVRCYRLFPVAAGSTYCTGKPNSLGCTPFMSLTGTASVSSTSSFMVACNNLVNKKAGVLIYSHTPGASAFQGGFLCLKTPIRRLGPVSSGGSPTGNDCTGAFQFDFNPYIQSGNDPAIVVGSQIFCQYWSRDPQAPSGTSLSNAATFLVNP